MIDMTGGETSYSEKVFNTIYILLKQYALSYTIASQMLFQRYLLEIINYTTLLHLSH